MGTRRLVLAIDQSTQGTKAMLLDAHGSLVCRRDVAHKQLVDAHGWVSHDPEEIYGNVITASKQVIAESGVDAKDIEGIGITNQRETTVAWDATTGRPICDAIVWHCVRAREICEQLSNREGLADEVHSCTGLALSPYYPASKMAWVLRNVDAAVALQDHGDLRLGTIDAWLIWKLTGGREFRCDYSNASRTQLFDIERLEWAPHLCEEFGIQSESLPQVTDSDALFGMTDLERVLPRQVPIHAVLGDSHAALFGQGCVCAGRAKATYGTGSSVMLNTGHRLVRSSHGLATSLAWRMRGRTDYVLEGNVNYTGAVISWLRDDLGLISSVGEVESLCGMATKDDGLYLVPAFTGLGAPYWESGARGMLCGMSRTTGRPEVVRAAIECIAHQIADIVDAMCKDFDAPLDVLRADGGPTANAYLMQCQADFLGCHVMVPAIQEMSGVGVGRVAALALGILDETPEDEARAAYAPREPPGRVGRARAGWAHAVECTIGLGRV